MMSKKTYEQVAQVIYESLYVEDVISGLADMFARDNPRFNREKFLEACRTGKHIRRSIGERS
jgi:hypothetical protein